jgi:hypothetical protein
MTVSGMSLGGIEIPGGQAEVKKTGDVAEVVTMVVAADTVVAGITVAPDTVHREGVADIEGWLLVSALSICTSR